jgi:hypothetical protein
MNVDPGPGRQSLLSVPWRILSGADHAGFRLALACSRARREPSDAAIWRAAEAIEDWTEALKVIRRHRIAGLAYHALAGRQGAMPEAVRRTLAAQAKAQARNGLALAGEAVRIAAAFDAATTSVAFLKGPVLSHQLHGDLGRRHSRDLDLIVAPGDRAAAAALLSGLGYRAAGDFDMATAGSWTAQLNEWEYRHEHSGIIVELHWRFCPNMRLAEPLSRFASWGSVAVGTGRGLRTLTGDSLAAYLCLHGSLHAWSRLKWLADLDALMACHGPEGPERLLSFAARAELTRPVAQGLALAGTLLDMPLSPTVRRQLAAEPALPKLGRIALTAMTTGRGVVEIEETPLGTTRVRLSHFWLGHGWRHWWAQAAAAMASGEDRTMVRLPSALSPLYRILRPFLWALRRVTPLRSGRPLPGEGRRGR